MELIPDVYMVSSTSFGIGHFADCSVYLVDCGDGLVLIDAGAGIDVGPLVKVVRHHGFDETCITHVINTHGHFDHAGGDSRIHGVSGCEIAIHARGVEAIETGDPAKVSAPPGRSFETVRVTRRLEDGDRLRIGKYEFAVVWTPGHTEDSACVLMEHSWGTVLFSGDTACANGQPGVMTVASDFKAYYQSVDRIAGLGVDILFPGHGIFVLSRAFEHLEHLYKRLSSVWSDFTIHPTHPFWPGAQIRLKMG